MTLVEAYRNLQWSDPLVFERKVLGEGPFPAFPRGIGTSSHMLVELYLDMYQDQKQVRHSPVEFLVLCVNTSHANLLRTEIGRIHGKLGFEVNLNLIKFFPINHSTDRLQGVNWYSWAIFCDHAVREQEGWKADRNRGFYQLIRRFVPFGENWKAYDRDGGFIGVLTSEGKSNLLDQATCPITVEGISATTYAATQDPKILPLIRLRKAFQR